MEYVTVMKGTFCKTGIVNLASLNVRHAQMHPAALPAQSIIEDSFQIIDAHVPRVIMMMESTKLANV